MLYYLNILKPKDTILGGISYKTDELLSHFIAYEPEFNQDLAIDVNYHSDGKIEYEIFRMIGSFWDISNVL